jgi:hypothetical protein
VDERDERPEPELGGDEDIGEFRGVVLNDVGPVQTVPQPPPGPAQPPLAPSTPS